MMGCGKTTVARELSSLYGLPQADTDSVIVSRYGEINQIFAQKGEEYFRTVEAEVVGELAKSLRGGVISLGGGAVLRAENVQNLKETGRIVYLRTRPETLVARLLGDGTRPLLRGDLENKVNTILAARAPIYEGVADLVVETDGLTPRRIAKTIWEKIK